MLNILCTTVKPVFSGHPQKDQKLVFKRGYRLMLVKSIAECSLESILQYFRPALSHHLFFYPINLQHSSYKPGLQLTLKTKKVNFIGH